MSGENINYEYDYFPNIVNNNNDKEELKCVFSDEKLNIEQFYSLFEKIIVPLKDRFNNYQFVVTGAIGSGKSTILEILNQLFLKYNFKLFACKDSVFYGIALSLLQI